MRRAAAILLLVVAAEPALAGGRGSVCREPSVVDEITREVGAVNYYGEVDPRSMAERPTADRNVVHCQVCVFSDPYGSGRPGDPALAQCVPNNFEVRILTGGFVVRPLR